jgi:hypothetical protein
MAISQSWSALLGPKAARRPATTGGLPSLPNAVPPSDFRRGNLDCYASFNKLVLGLVEVRVRGIEGVGLPKFTINTGRPCNLPVS